MRSLEEDKNRLYQQVMELRRQIDEEYNIQIESFRQRADLLENRIFEYEGNFQLAQTQLQEKNETLQRVTSLNEEIQSILSAIPQASYQPTETYVPSVPVHRSPVTTTVLSNYLSYTQIIRLLLILPVILLKPLILKNQKSSQLLQLLLRGPTKILSVKKSTNQKILKSSTLLLLKSEKSHSLHKRLSLKPNLKVLFSF